MDRRQFLKNTMLGAGALATSSTVSAKKATTTVKSKTSLPAKGGFITEPARELAVVDSADIIVVGGGPAGVAAAIAAKRQGADVLMLERQYFLGGLFTGCGVTPIIDMYSPLEGGKSVQNIKGIAEELCQRLEEVHMLSFEKIRPKADPEAAKYLMEDMIGKVGVRLLYGVQAAQVVMSGNRIDAVIVEGKSGRVAIKTKFVIDCSGDGDILEWSNEDFTVYKDDIGAMWRVGNTGKSQKGNPTPTKNVRTRHLVGEKAQDGLDMYNLTRVQLNLRKTMWEDAENLKKEEGCEDLFLLDTPSVVGVRITRVLNSVKNVTLDGAMTSKSYKDVIGFAGCDSTLRYKDKKYAGFQRKMWQVPYSSLTPKRVENLLVAGRCFGFERDLTYDSREVGTCFMTGQAAGTAAGLAINARCSCRDVDIEKLQSNLRAQNVKLDW